MTSIPLPVVRASRIARAKPILYVRSGVALGMIATWVVSAVSGVALWLAADGRGAFEAPAALGLTKHAWDDIHVVASFLAVGLTLAHVSVMRRGVLSYARLLATGRRSHVGPATRRPKAVVYVRAIAVVTMVALVPISLATGIVPWLAPEVRRAGQQILLLVLTKHQWVDLHTAVTMGAIAIALTHVIVVRVGLMADVRLLATGRRSGP